MIAVTAAFFELAYKNDRQTLGGGVAPMKVHRPIPLVMHNEVARPPVVENDIRNRAYQLYQERGRVDGFELEDWFRAEAEILSHHVQRKAS